jgi:DnaJ-class molecular chaperone
MTDAHDPEPRPKYEVCPRCEGEGTIVHPSLSVWTESDRAEDPESFDAMMHGAYDVQCTECHGRRVVTTQDHTDFLERQADHRVRLMESGIYPGSPDWDTL